MQQSYHPYISHTLQNSYIDEHTTHILMIPKRYKVCLLSLNMTLQLQWLGNAFRLEPQSSRPDLGGQVSSLSIALM